MLEIPVIKGNINKALKIFKRKFKQTGVLKEVRERKNYIKHSSKKRKQRTADYNRSWWRIWKRFRSKPRR